MSGQETVLDDFLGAAGKSLGIAQKDIGVPDGMKPGMMLSDAELSIKVGMRYEGDKLMVEPISSSASAQGSVVPEAVSTITIRYVASHSAKSTSDEPVRTKTDIIADVAKRKDVVKLQEILGKLNIEANYVRDMNLWAVKVTDNAARTVRSITLEDKQ
ncbi:MAG: hypothetical protein FDX21_10630 [Chlorobium sp.]|nr:MAG: hypothetical protein FDX21_10630 [Chlorobium sp.]